MEGKSNIKVITNDLLDGFINISNINAIVSKNTTKILFSNDSLEIINWETLISFEYNKWIVLENRGIKFKRIKHDTKECLYLTECNPELSDKNYSYFGYHSHSCKEVGKVIKGSLIERVENNKKYEKGDIFVYPKNFSHKPLTYEKSVYLVEFINPNIK